MGSFPAEYLEQFKDFKRLDSPSKVQDFLNGIHQNFEPRGASCRSPLEALRAGRAHCMEGAMLAAAAFWYHGQRPLLLDLRTTDRDEDHVVALFRRGRLWGAVSKTNHAVLRYRDPIFRNIRELALSYFNEYFLDDGVKTLREYSAPFDLRHYGQDWLATQDDLWNIALDLDHSRHFKVLPAGSPGFLRRAEGIEIKAGKIVEWKE